MWRRVYLLLILVRLYFALSPSYLHPDENFQGPEVIAGKISSITSSSDNDPNYFGTGEVFSYPVHHTWEFTADYPVRSTFPLWLVYGLPMVILRSLWEGIGQEVPPAIVYWTLRVLMFTLSFVLEDWAMQELVQSPRQRRVAMLLMASSYVTWTYQTHTFSNSIETLVVLWSLVLIARIVEDKVSISVLIRSIHANSGVGTLWGVCLRCPGILDCARGIQPYHFPGIYHSPSFPTAPSF
jgi:phosphatidylinositol glycan class Z